MLNDGDRLLSCLPNLAYGEKSDSETCSRFKIVRIEIPRFQKKWQGLNRRALLKCNRSEPFNCDPVLGIQSKQRKIFDSRAIKMTGIEIVCGARQQPAFSGFG